ncbi:MULTISPECIES: PAS domain S-box protein [unclassified Tolypothrix]|uniref:PAS domain S-box protein n=1 Tax=unclassified Tolypothrix TaxID=2649714 RepID=UPI0005EAAC2D|nr:MULTISPECIES: PAS domain S-box protein [unclassified Tolypothrix]EKF00635.1 sensor histidine kinase [Tolypothrix sp. PCC 7601]MBE9084202.1 PAS domain S-box protein [Tolypothrix sp. LEGE 11397]UYD28691.1 PAS domain S-box protein [Tolypothrix sp. PCC 7712]UYD35396.1 PAS domain S-box protein [Tolypothrix sp. PCC 7601]
MMKWSVIQKLKAVFILVLAVLFTNAVVSHSTTMQLVQNWQLITHSQEIITQVQTLLTTLNNAETAQRNYLITISTNNLVTYLQASQQINNNIQILKQLTQAQQNHQWVAVLEQKITDRLNILQAEVVVLQNQGFDTARQSVLSHQQEMLSHDIPRFIHESLASEQKILQQRNQQLQVTSRKSMATFLLAAIIDFLLVALLYDLLWCYIKRLQQTELNLRQSENRLRAIIDAEPECLKLIAKDGTLLEINASGLAMLELESAENLIGQAFTATILPEYREAFVSLHERVCQGYKGNLEYEIVGSQGTRRWLETHAVPLHNEADGTFLHLAVTRDITKRQQAEQKIREQAALLDVATDAIVVRNIHNQILFWNQGAEGVYGWKAEEVLGKNVVDLLYKDSSPQLEDAFLTVLRAGEWRGELQQLTKQGKEIIVESRWTLMRDSQNQPKSILSVSTEITQKKQLEAQLLRSQRLESIGTLAGGIAHDLNNVLAPVLMSVELLRMKLPDQQSQRILQTLESNVKRGANLLKQVLSFARGIEGKKTIVQTRLLIQEIEQIIQQTFPKSITCQVDLSASLWYVFGNTTELHQVLMNLVVNARDAMPDGGILKISAENVVIDEKSTLINIDAQIGAYIAISVRDTGTGIPPEIQERIFEPFFTTKEVGKGTGLGLSTAIGIIKNHNGFVNVNSKVNQGTEFQVYLPAFSNSTQPLHTPEIAAPTGNGEWILLVDDEAAIREITKSSLEKHNYQVLTASNGIEAVAIYAQYQQQISVVLLDMMMPVMDGAIAIRKLQTINPHVKIIALSGLLSPQNIKEVTDMGVSAFLSKPCTSNELLQTIARIKVLGC